MLIIKLGIRPLFYIVYCIKMEKNFERVMDNICSSPGVIGCVFADQQGLSLGAKGKSSNQSAGFIAALANQAAKLEPNSKPPVITLENDTHVCMIQKMGPITGAIYKQV